MRLLDWSANATVILGLCLVLAALGRRLSAAAKHFFCAATLVLVVVLPLLDVLPFHSRQALFTFTVRSVSTSRDNGLYVLWIGVLWACGSCVVLVRYVAGFGYLAWQTGRASMPISGLAPSNVTVRFAAVTTPVVWGWFRPQMLLPLAFPDWRIEEQKAAIDHELAHVRRLDSSVALIAMAAQAMYWFHPLVWWVSTKLVEERECAADDRVVACGTDAATYARFLVSTARAMQSRSLFGCTLLGGSLRRRVQHLLGSGHYSPGAGARILLVCGVSVLAAAALTSPIREVYRIGGDVTAPKILFKVEPQYTDESRRAKITGSVLLKLIISRDGRTESVQVERSLTPDLDRQAVRAISAWRFAPAMKNGRRVSVQANVEVDFQLL